MTYLYLIEDFLNSEITIKDFAKMHNSTVSKIRLRLKNQASLITRTVWGKNNGLKGYNLLSYFRENKKMFLKTIEEIRSPFDFENPPKFKNKL